ncbi:MAG TPA: YceI family protein [Candidatus Limnocylindria bacterium]
MSRSSFIAPALVLVAVVTAACGGAADVVTTSPSPSPAPPSTAGATPATTAAASGSSWAVSDRSKATVRVREQLVGVSLPSDAVLTATGAKGAFALNADGTFDPGSKITFDLSTLSSDQRDRDNFVKQDTLAVRQFPTADFVPTKTTGLTMPLPASGSFTFTLVGNMTVKGTTKEVSFDVTARRDGADLTATATANPSWKFGDFGMRAPSVPFRVLSVTDEIRVAIDLVATGPKT